MNNIIILKGNESDYDPDYVNEFLNKIRYYRPSLVIVATQKSTRGKNNLQTNFKNKLYDSCVEYKLLAKIDSMREVDSGVKGYMSSFLTTHHSLRTRIYYNSQKVVLNFENNNLSKKSSFALPNSFENKYNSKTNITPQNSTPQNSTKNKKMRIERYYMKRYTSPKEGYGRISVGIQLKLPNDQKLNDQKPNDQKLNDQKLNDQKLYTLIVSNFDCSFKDNVRNNEQLFDNRNHKALNNNNYFKKNRDENTYAILTSPKYFRIYYSFGSDKETFVEFAEQYNITKPKPDLPFLVYTC